MLAIGNSLGVGQTVTMGIVERDGPRQLGITDFEDFIQTDAAINAGNSGGALVNSRGELVGINTATISAAPRDATMPEGIGFAIPVNLVRGVMEQLIANGRVIRGYLGVDTNDLPEAQAGSSASTARPCCCETSVAPPRPPGSSPATCSRTSTASGCSRSSRR